MPSDWRREVFSRAPYRDRKKAGLPVRWRELRDSVRNWRELPCVDRRIRSKEHAPAHKRAFGPSHRALRLPVLCRSLHSLNCALSISRLGEEKSAGTVGHRQEQLSLSKCQFNGSWVKNQSINVIRSIQK